MAKCDASRNISSKYLKTVSVNNVGGLSVRKYAGDDTCLIRM